MWSSAETEGRAQGGSHSGLTPESEVWEACPLSYGKEVINTHFVSVRTAPGTGIRLSLQGGGQPAQAASVGRVPARARWKLSL